MLLQDLSPQPLPFLGQVTALQLAMLQQASAIVENAPTLESRASVAEVVRILSTKFRDLSDLIRSEGAEPVEAMRPYLPSSIRFVHEMRGADWYDLLLSLHVTSWLLGDFFIAYAGGLPDDARRPVIRILTSEAESPLLEDELRGALAENPRLSSRLAMWGRRLVGDTLLQMYLAVNGTVDDEGHVAPSGERLEPAINDIVAAHSRRMDLLGLTA